MADRTAPLRVALVGDSQAFSLEVPYEDSWARTCSAGWADWACRS